MQKKTAFHDDEDIDMLKLGCTLSNLSIIYLHKSIYAKVYPIAEGDNDLSKKVEKMLLMAHLTYLD